VVICGPRVVPHLVSDTAGERSPRLDEPSGFSSIRRKSHRRAAPCASASVRRRPSRAR
jgi:hypothetical protein